MYYKIPIFFLTLTLSIGMVADAPTAEAIKITEEEKVIIQEIPKEENPKAEVSKEKTPAGLIQESPAVGSDYFNDAIFFGDSVSLKLSKYVTAKHKTEENFMGKAQLLTAGSFGSGNALKPVNKDSLHPTYKGKKMSLEDIVVASKSKKVYIMFGMNDLAPYGVDGAVGNMETLLGNIKAKSPDVNIFVQSATPIVKEQQGKKLSNPNLLIYNDKLEKLCKEKGYYFVDVASTVRDKDGNLIRNYCSDPDGMGIHLSDSACQKWIDYLHTHTAIIN